jgi:asparagine synthase (glutamine-hydrolysing)
VCGITGALDLNGHGSLDRASLERMTESIIHRGPDDSGIYLKNGIGLGFRRLSIIDLAQGNQPHSNEDGSLISICNGEIFNYQELKQELQARDHRFRTDCDVEVLVHLYEEHGADLLNRLNGQFALAIYDVYEQRLLLARDQMGVLPLFYTVADGTLVFGSEIKAILEHPSVDRAVDLTGFDQVLSLPGLVSPRTMFSNIHSLKPGHFLVAGHGEVRVHEYWDLVFPEQGSQDSSRSEPELVDQLDQQLRRSVRQRLNADVPVGFYLSGGLDSSLIAAVINDLLPGDRWHSFSIGFNQADIDERKYQQLVSEMVSSDHHELVFDWPDILTRLQTAIYHTECPVRESYDTCSLALSELVREHGIKVILTGEGSDEMFGGYVGYRFDAVRQQQEQAAPAPEVFLEQEIRERLWGDANLIYERDFFRYRETRAAVYASELADQLDQFCCESSELVDRDKIRGRHPVHKRSYLDFKLRLADHLLSDHGDRVALANAVEARYPFLDIELIELAKTIPVELLLRGSVEKYIVRKVAERYLPDAIVNREKFGFVAPGSPYLLKQNLEWLNDLLSYDKLKREGYLNPDTVTRLIKIYTGDGFSVNQTFDIDLLMIIITFEIFLETFAMPNRS